MYLLTVAVVTSCVTLVFGQSTPCLTSEGRRKECVPLDQCELLGKLARKTDKSASELTLLGRSFCGHQRPAEATVCCPEILKPKPRYCSTPDGELGECTSLFDCPYLSSLLQQPVVEENVNFVKQSRCILDKTVNNSVCCVPPSLERFGEEDDEYEPDSCQAQMTAFPPARDTGCCGDSTGISKKIVGGNATAIDEYPWAVIIEYKKIGYKKIETALWSLKCGGVLISGKYVLTAAHCITGEILQTAIPKIVRLGEYDITHDGPDCVNTTGPGQDCTFGEKRVRIEKTIPHPDYKQYYSHRNDIGLIRMRETAPYTDFIRPICLPSKDLTQPENMPPSFSLYAVGWGATETKLFSNIKWQFSLPFVDLEECQSLYTRGIGLNLRLWKGQFCAGGVENKDTCNGDSGGPLVYEDHGPFELVGLVSIGLKDCGSNNIPAIYTNVYEYLDWINSNIRA